MPAFTYSAVNVSGKTVNGSIETPTKGEAFRRLQRDGLTPLRVTVSDSAVLMTPKEKEKSDALSGEAPKLKKMQLILFTEEMADLLDAGLQLDQALRVIGERQDDLALRSVAERLRVQLRDGTDFSHALRKASPSFDNLYCNMVSAGEASGSMAPILRRLAGALQQMYDLQKKVVSAMVYPSFMIGSCILLIVVFMTVLVPQLTELLKKSGQQLPWMTELLIQVSRFFTNWWWVMLIVLVAGLAMFRSMIATVNGRLWWDRTKLQLPLFGPVMATRIYAQLCQGLGNLVHNGIPLLNGLKLMTRAIPNVYLRSVLGQAGETVGEGASLSTSLRKTQQFPSLMLDIIAVGEQTGRIAHALDKAGVRYDKELDSKIRRLTSLISPVVLIIMAVVVTFVAYSIISAIFQSINSVKRY